MEKKYKSCTAEIGKFCSKHQCIHRKLLLWEVWCEVCGFKGKMPYKQALDVGFAHKKGQHQIKS